MSLTHGLMDVRARNVALTRVANEFERLTGLDVAINPSLDTQVTLHIEALAIDAALERILRGFNYVVAYDPATGAAQSVLVLGDRGTPTTTLASTYLALTDPDKSVRIALADSLQDAESLETLIADTDPSVRMQAVEALNQIEPAVAIRLIAPALHDLRATVREIAVETLAEIDDDSAVAMLETALADTSPIVREEAVNALAAREGPQVVRLLQTAELDLDEGVASAAARVLEKR